MIPTGIVRDGNSAQTSRVEQFRLGIPAKPATLQGVAGSFLFAATKVVFALVGARRERANDGSRRQARLERATDVVVQRLFVVRIVGGRGSVSRPAKSRRLGEKKIATPDLASAGLIKSDMQLGITMRSRPDHPH